MIDMISAGPLGLGVADTQTTRAANILSIQVGSLEYAPDLGIDLKYFLSEEFSFQNESFKAYLIQTLANNSINVATIKESIEDLYNRFTFNITPSESDSSLVSR